LFGCLVGIQESFLSLVYFVSWPWDLTVAVLAAVICSRTNAGPKRDSGVTGRLGRHATDAERSGKTTEGGRCNHPLAGVAHKPNPFPSLSLTIHIPFQ